MSSWRGNLNLNNMRSISSDWKALAGTAANRAKEYVVQKEYKNTYENVKAQLKGEVQSGANWRSRSGGNEGCSGLRNENNCYVEKVQIFPGWAVRRFRPEDENNNDEVEAPFDLEVFVAGYAASSRPPELATRSQKVFMQLAKRFAQLPKLPTEHESEPTPMEMPKLSRSTEDLLKLNPLPITPAEMANSEEHEMAALEAQLKRAELDTELENTSLRSLSLTSSPPRAATPAAETEGKTADYIANYTTLPFEELKKLHINLNTRLEPFWSSFLSNRKVKISIHATMPQSTEDQRKEKEDLLIDFGDFLNVGSDESSSNEPLAIKEVLTTPNGDFQQTVRIPWETLCTHPRALYMAFGDRSPSSKYNVYVHAELLPPLSTSPSYKSENPIPIVTSTATVTISQTRLRVISDIDDTVKKSDILGGAKLVFHNVFVSELSRLVIRDMSDWYKRLWDRGVRFHYVSNSPFELLQVINEFIVISELPEGSVKLRSYTGRSLFNGLISSPSVRKKTNVVDVLGNFRESQFILVGDSGEQDLELYASLARERPNQILGIFIRDVSTMPGEPLTDPTGLKWQEGQSDDILHLINNPNTFDSNGQQEQQRYLATYANRIPPRRASSMNSTKSPVRQNTASSITSNYLSNQQSSFITEEPQPVSTPTLVSPSPTSKRYAPQSEPNINPQLQALPLPVRCRIELQIRVNKARDEIPPHIKLRVFKDPLECTEAEEIMYNLHL